MRQLHQDFKGLPIGSCYGALLDSGGVCSMGRDLVYDGPRFGI